MASSVTIDMSPYYIREAVEHSLNKAVQQWLGKSIDLTFLDDTLTSIRAKDLMTSKSSIFPININDGTLVQTLKDIISHFEVKKPVASRIADICLCGIHRSDCDYHK